MDEDNKKNKKRTKKTSLEVSAFLSEEKKKKRIRVKPGEKANISIPDNSLQVSAMMLEDEENESSSDDDLRLRSKEQEQKQEREEGTKVDFAEADMLSNDGYEEERELDAHSKSKKKGQKSNKQEEEELLERPDKGVPGRLGAFLRWKLGIKSAFKGLGQTLKRINVIQHDIKSRNDVYKAKQEDVQKQVSKKVEEISNYARYSDASPVNNAGVFDDPEIKKAAKKEAKEEARAKSKEHEVSKKDLGHFTHNAIIAEGHNKGGHGRGGPSS